MTRQRPATCYRRTAWLAVLPFVAMCATAPVRVEQLSLDEKIGQMFVPGGHGTFMAESSPRYQTLLHHVRDNRVGGIIWFVSNVYETALLNQRLQAHARIPLLISADLEAGVGMRFLDTTFWPSAMAIAATGDPAYAEKAGRVVAREARALGINHVFAPVADVNVDPDNPVINTRSFGENPQEVARYVSALVRGIQSERILACAKHFPGHGDTHVDSHRSLPVLDVTRERLDQVELVPFRAAIDAGVKSIMIGHLSIPAIEPTPAPIRTVGHGENPYGTEEHEVPKEGTIPATISPKIITGLLRNELKFDGLIVTDAFDMGGLTEHFDAGEAAVRAIEAGEDQVIMSPNVDAAVAAVKEAVKSGRISESRIDDSVRRILAAKEFTTVNTSPQTEEIFRTIDSEEHRALAAEIASHALTLVRDETNALPLKRDARVLLVSVTDYAGAPNPLLDFEKELRSRLTVPPQVINLGPNSAAPAIPENVDAVVVALAVRARSGAGRIAVPESAKAVISKIKGEIAISFGSPYLLREIPEAGTYLCAYGIQPVMQTAAVKALFGETPITGRLPVTIPGFYKRGHGLRTED